MLKTLGFTKFAYDYRSEHIPTFDAEMEELKKQGIELTAWWFPGTLNDEARGILDVLKRHQLKAQLWVTGAGEPTKTQDEQLAKVKAEAARIRPIAEEAGKIGCSVALYNHGGWFGEPENQLAIIEELKLPNVGIVYNQHHGHAHLDRFPDLLQKMLPHLVCLNLNGMVRDGERRGQKILPMGQGDLDLELLRTIARSGYRGPIGILGHTQDDAEHRLQDNLDGLDWLVKQLDGSPPGPKPKPRTPVPAPAPDPKRSGAKVQRPLENHWGRAVIGFDWKEADSVDNRWNQTEIGPFLASIVPVPKTSAIRQGAAGERSSAPPDRGAAGGSPSPESNLIAKGLSIKVGDRGQGTVCYDTQSMSLRAGWTGGFLKFDPARYGLINSPQIAGDLAFVSLRSSGWEGQEFRYLGHTIREDRVVLSARINGTLVRESPWLEQCEGLSVFTRTIEIAPSDRPLSYFVGAFAGRPETLEIDGTSALSMTDGQHTVACVAIGDIDGLRLASFRGSRNGTVFQFPSGAKTRRVKLFLWSGEKTSLSTFAMVVKGSPPPEDLSKLAQPGKPRWAADIVTQGKLGSDDQSPYAVDTLTLPFENPYKVLMFVGGHDFFANGDIALCTVHGDVWRVSGVDDDLDRLVWKRMATGLCQPLGLKIVDDSVHVLGRDQITRLVDHNGDGEADEYQCVSNAYRTSTGGHDYVTCLETNSRGEFHLVHATEGLLRVSPDGKSAQTVANGFRNPNGMGLGPDDVLTVAPQEGEWTPGSMIIEVKEGGYYGYGGPKAGHGPAGHDQPLAWLPRIMDNSSGGQVWVTSDRFGPLAGQLLHLSYGKCRMMLVLRERIGQVVQGAVVEFPGVGFSSGAMRGRFSPHDGQLYVSGLKGWASAAVDDGCLQRVRYTGRPVTMPIDRRTYANGMAITFSDPLDPATAEDPGSYHLEQWNYRYSAAYGSPDLKVSDPSAEGHDEVAVRSATLLEGGRTVFLEIDPLRPAHQTQVEYSLQTAAGQPLRQALVATTHVVPERRMDEGQLRRRAPMPEQLVDESQLAPGVLVRFSQGSATSVRTSRLAAWYVGQSPGGGLKSGAFDATAAGFVKVPLRGDYAFHFTGRGSAKLRVNGKQILDGTGDLARLEPGRAALHQGYNRLDIEYSSPPDGASQLRLWWTDGTFAAEPVPPTALYHDTRDEALRTANQLRDGYWLVAERRCDACHGMRGQPTPRNPTGPSLADADSRLEPAWVYRWLLDPAAIRPQAHMPRMFDAEQPADRQAAADIAAYLATITAKSPVARQRVQPEPSSGGAALFEDLGCIACHRLTAPAELDPYDRLPLVHVAAKFQPGKLAEFLRRPQAHFPHTRMPDFALSEAEAAALAEHLSSSQRPEPAAAAELANADAARGQALFREHRCDACHATSQRGSATGVELIPLRDLARGCLAGQGADYRRAPHFGLSASEAGDLAAFYGRPELASPPVTPGEMLPHVMASLRCGACHNRDHHIAPLRRIIAEESEHGLVPDSLPNLTWTGEKLHGDWLSKQLEGTLPYRTRPWLKARMPAFGATYAGLLAEGLANEHGLNYSYSPRSESTRQPQAALGDRLTRKDGGLDCRSCHAVGRDKPTGDERTLVAQGINFVHTGERMQDEFYLRFVLDPPRHDVTTRMPKLAPDGRRTNVTTLLGGDARRQFEAIWQFIRTVDAE